MFDAPKSLYPPPPELRLSIQSTCEVGSGFDADLATTDALDQVVANGLRETRPGFNLRTTLQIRIGPIRPPAVLPRPGARTPETALPTRKTPSLLACWLRCQLNEFDQNAVVAHTPAARNPFNLSRHGRGKGHTAPDPSVAMSPLYTIMVQPRAALGPNAREWLCETVTGSQRCIMRCFASMIKATQYELRPAERMSRLGSRDCL